MSSFLTLLIAVLNDQPEMPELDELVACRPDDSIVLGHEFPRELLFKLARLQTLGSQEVDRTATPDLEEVKRIACETRQDNCAVIAGSLSIGRDAGERIALLDRLIIEFVREELPRESNRFSVRYCVTEDWKVCYIPAPTPLD